MKAMPTKTKPRRRRTMLWLLLAVLLAATIWAFSSEGPGAQGIQEFVGWKHDQVVVNATFLVTPNNFRYYKFSLPLDASNFSVVGHFASAAHNVSSDQVKTADAASDNAIEVYVFSESGFTLWQHGVAQSALYNSGKVSQGKIQAEVPAGAGNYFLIFSNKFSPATAKNVNATVSLRHKSGLFKWFHR
jgi:hypothetical protein